MQVINSDSSWLVVSAIKGNSELVNIEPSSKEIEVDIKKLEKLEKLENFELIKLCIEIKDEKIWREFYRRFNEPIECYVKKTLGYYKTNSFLKHREIKSLQEDLIQETYLALLKNNRKALRNYKDKNRCFYAYLHRITVNTVINYFRQLRVQKRQAKVISLDDVSINSLKDSSLISSGAYWDLVLLKCELENLLNKVSSTTHSNRNKRIFLLFTILGLNTKEIVKSFDAPITIYTVENVINNMRKKLKQILINSYDYY